MDWAFEDHEGTMAEAPGRALQAFLSDAVTADPSLGPVAATIEALAGAATKTAALIALGPLAAEALPEAGSRNSDGDVQKALDLLSDRLFMEALAAAPVAVLVSEELEAPKPLQAGAPLVVAIDPLDGSSNIDANASIGTIFSILPALPNAPTDAAHFAQPGRQQCAAGFVVYGPQTLLILSIGGPTTGFILDPRSERFVEIGRALQIPQDSREYAINASNTRHWDPAVRAFIEDCQLGEDGRLGRNFNMRWVGSMVADAYRIFTRGGVFLYPGDKRKGYTSGRLRLLYEVSPMAFLVERAGGKATDGLKPILDIVPSDVHQRSPLVFGSAHVVDTIADYHKDPKLHANRSPLFDTRGLMMG
jgi:fructose-1,6-bisphosphatase I